MRRLTAHTTPKSGMWKPHTLPPHVSHVTCHVAMWETAHPPNSKCEMRNAKTRPPKLPGCGAKGLWPTQPSLVARRREPPRV